MVLEIDTNTYPPVHPTKNAVASIATKIYTPAIATNDAPDIQSAAVAIPLNTVGTCLPAT